MASKQVENDVQRTRVIAEAAHTHGPELAQRVSAALKPAHVTADVLGTVILAHARCLEASCDALIAADDALTAELGDDVPVFRKRDQTSAQLRARLVSLRSVLDTTCGPDTARKAGFTGSTPEDDPGMIRLARAVADHLTAHPPRSTQGGVHIDAHALVSGLSTLADTLDHAGRDVRREKREEQGARAKRDAAWNELLRRTTAMALLIEGWFRLAGLDDLADRVAPARHAAHHDAGEAEGTPAGGDPAATPST